MLNRRSSLIFCLLAVTLSLLASSVSAQVLRRGLGPEPDSLDIHQAQGLPAINLLRDLREGLVSFDAAGAMVPGVASSWEVLDGGRRYRFRLRPEARWSDGTALVAQDFVRAWRKAFSPGTSAVTVGLLQGVVNGDAVLRGELPPERLGIHALSEAVLEVRIEQPAPWLLELLAHPVSYPLHPLAGDDVRSSPVNGAYQLQQWVPRSVIRLARNAAFHASGQVAFEQVEYFPIEEPNTELARYRAGELDITETIPAGRFQWLRENHHRDLRISPYLGTFWLGLNLRHDRLGSSVPLRRALALAIDRDILVRVVLGAGELPAWSIVPPGVVGYDGPRIPMADASQAEREAEARRLFATSAMARGRKLPLELRYNTSGLHRRIAVAVAAMWKHVLGLNVELLNEEWKVFVNNRRLGTVTQVFRGGWIADYADPASFLNLFTSRSELNTTFYADDTFDALMAATAIENADSRFELLRRAESRLLEDMPVIPLYYYVSRHLVRPGIAGFTDNVRDIHLTRYLRQEER